MIVIIACIDYIDSVMGKAAKSSLMIRNVDSSLKERLRVRAARNGRSMEAELRQILNDVLGDRKNGEPNLAEAIRRRFARFGGVELEEHPPVPVRKSPFE